MGEPRRYALHAISSGKQALDDVVPIVRAVAPAVDAFHVREKQRNAREQLEWARRLLADAGLPASKLAINDRADVALAVGARCLQLAWHSLPPDEARRLVDACRARGSPSATLVGVSVHSAEDAREAERAGADYVIYGHVFVTGCKPGLEPRGIPALADVVRGAGLPVIALGGMTPENAAETLATGCAGVAVLSGIVQAPDPAAAAAHFRAALDACPGRPLHPWPFS
eukprot:tig00020830_g14457.t1